MKNKKSSFKLALSQINVTVGDLASNCKKIAEGIARARRAGADLVAFPELAVTGYPPEDLLFKRSFVDANLAAVRRLAKLTRGITAIAGFVDRGEAGALYNAAAVLSNGEWTGSYRKVELPNYGVFDERRYFKTGSHGYILEVAGVSVGLSICEDIWLPQSFVYKPPYRGGVSLILNISASPYHRLKLKERETLVRTLAQTTGAAAAYLNLVGGQDELVFDGGSFVVSPEGKVLAQAKYLEEDFLLFDFSKSPKKPAPHMAEEAEVYKALVLGTRDYIEKNGFDKALIGLSGGIDSALVAQTAVDALGASRVIGVTMPSRYTSKGTLADAESLADNLKIKLLKMPLENVFHEYLETLKPVFEKRKPDIAEENLQARIRGNYLMALSNKFGHLVLTTGNKSEMATGYCTLYGDMAGGFAMLKDVPKTLVYRLARWRNKRARRPLIPESTLRRAPTAELRPNQKDRDPLPPYPVLDEILRYYVEEDYSQDEIVRKGFPRKIVQKVLRLVDRNEYKRRQAPPGIKITPKAFGRDRRMPITNKFSA